MVTRCGHRMDGVMPVDQQPVASPTTGIFLSVDSLVFLSCLSAESL